MARPLHSSGLHRLRRRQMESSPDQPALGFVGVGRAGSALALSLAQAGYPVLAVYSRSEEHGRAAGQLTGATVCSSAADVARLSEVLFLTVPDGAIVSVVDEMVASAAIRPEMGVVHVSGSERLDILTPVGEARAYRGVFHPFQALAGPESASLLRGAYVGLSGDDELLPVLRSMVSALSARPIDLTSVERVPYHLAAVLAASHATALVHLARQLLVTAGVPEDDALPALLALARGSLSNYERAGASSALTGPAVRGDADVVGRHVAYLRERDPQLADAYRALSTRMLGDALELRSRDEILTELNR